MSDEREEEENGRVRTARGNESTDAFATEMCIPVLVRRVSTGTARVPVPRRDEIVLRVRDIFNLDTCIRVPATRSHSRSHSLVGRHPSGSIAVPFSAVFAHDGDRLSHDVAHGELPGLRRHGHVQRDRRL